MLVVGVGDADDFGGLESAAGAWSFVAAGSWIGVDGVSPRVVSLAICRVESIEEIVEACASENVSNLVECDPLWIDQCHGVGEIQIRLAVEETGLVSQLIYTATDRVKYRTLAHKPFAEIGEEDVQVVRQVGLRCEFSNTKTVSFDGLIVDRDAIECTQARWCRLLVAISQFKV